MNIQHFFVWICSCLQIYEVCSVHSLLQDLEGGFETAFKTMMGKLSSQIQTNETVLGESASPGGRVRQLLQTV